MSTMSDWVTAVCDEFGLELRDQRATITTVLDLTADVAHGVTRPAAPVTAFLVGLAAGRSADPDTAVEELARRLSERAKAWESERSG